MILIQNKQRTIAIDKKKIHADMQVLLQVLRYIDFDISIVVVNNATMRTYNKTYRNIDKPTDVLSFPFHQDLRAGKRIQAKDEQEKNLGDIIVSAPYIAAAATAQNSAFEAHLQKLLIHSLCHLLGYDHHNDHDWRRMRAKEGFLLKKLRKCSKQDSANAPTNRDSDC